MTESTFDALTAARDLKAAGFAPDQAEALAAQLRTAAGADHAALATKADLEATKADLEAGLAGLEGRIYRALWMQGAAIAALILAAKLL